METIFQQIRAERARQDAMQGRQNHKPSERVTILARVASSIAMDMVKNHYAGIEVDSDENWLAPYRADLIQVAAVAVAMIESLDRNNQSPQDRLIETCKDFIKQKGL